MKIGFRGYTLLNTKPETLKRVTMGSSWSVPAHGCFQNQGPVKERSRFHVSGKFQLGVGFIPAAGRHAVLSSSMSESHSEPQPDGPSQTWSAAR